VIFDKWEFPLQQAKQRACAWRNNVGAKAVKVVSDYFTKNPAEFPTAEDIAKRVEYWLSEGYPWLWVDGFEPVKVVVPLSKVRPLVFVLQ
jgi:hypothetical protein